MGYRSEVKMKFIFPTPPDRVAFMARAQLDAERFASADCPADRVHEFFTESINEYASQPAHHGATPELSDGGHICCEWDHVKWYESYPEIQYMNHLRELCHECHGAWAFARSGEETGDLEIEGEGFIVEDYHPEECKGYDTTSERFNVYDHVQTAQCVEWA